MISQNYPKKLNFLKKTLINRDSKPLRSTTGNTATWGILQHPTTSSEMTITCIRVIVSSLAHLRTANSLSIKWPLEKSNMQMSKCNLHKCQTSLGQVHKLVAHPSNIPGWFSFDPLAQITFLYLFRDILFKQIGKITLFPATCKRDTCSHSFIASVSSMCYFPLLKFNLSSLIGMLLM